jgi:hypothetical protein
VGLRARQAKRRTNCAHGLCLLAALAPPARAQESAHLAPHRPRTPNLFARESSRKRALSTVRERRAVDVPPAARQS